MALSFPRRAFVPLLAAVALAASACHPKVVDPHDPNFVVAQKNGADGWTITRAQLDHELDEYFRERGVTPQQVGPANMPALETAMLRNMVLEKLLLARAESKHFPDIDKLDTEAFSRLKTRFPTGQAFQEKLKQTGMTEDELKKRIHEQVLIEKLFETDALHDTEPTEKEIGDFYAGHPDLFREPLKLRASRVLVIVDEKATPAQKAEKKKVITAARTRVAKGEEFSKVASEVSDDRYSAPRGGDIGYFQRGENEQQFDDVAFGSKVGVLSPVFETPMGFQFLKITDIKPAGTATLEDARVAIADNLARLKVAKEKQDYAEKLMKDSNVTYNIPLVELPPATNAAPAEAGPSDQSAPPPADNSAPAESAPASSDTTTLPTTNAAPGGP